MLGTLSNDITHNLRWTVLSAKLTEECKNQSEKLTEKIALICITDDRRESTEQIKKTQLSI